VGGSASLGEVIGRGGHVGIVSSMIKNIQSPSGGQMFYLDQYQLVRVQVLFATTNQIFSRVSVSSLHLVIKLLTNCFWNIWSLILRIFFWLGYLWWTKLDQFRGIPI
jgi:hypothetical protein